MSLPAIASRAPSGSLIDETLWKRLGRHRIDRVCGRVLYFYAGSHSGCCTRVLHVCGLCGLSHPRLVAQMVCEYFRLSTICGCPHRQL